jgi:hypothetical protein
MPKKGRKSDFTQGLETVLNNPQVSPFGQHGPTVFREMIKASGLSLCDTMRYVGKKTKGTKSQKKMDEERSEARLEKLEAESAN